MGFSRPNGTLLRLNRRTVSFSRVPVSFIPAQSGFTDQFSVGAFADSAHEYLLKQWLLTGRSENKIKDLCVSLLLTFKNLIPTSHRYQGCQLYHRAPTLRYSRTRTLIRDRLESDLPFQYCNFRN